MGNAARWIAVLLLVVMPLLEAVARGQPDGAMLTNQPGWLPVVEAQSIAAIDASSGATPASRLESDNATLAAIKALHEEVKVIEARIAAQEARIAMLERSLDDQRKNARAANP